MAQPNWYRICVGCRAARHKNELLRFIKNIDNKLEIDIKQRKAGRGAYICPRASCFLQAQQNHGFEKSFQSKIDPASYDLIINQVKNLER